MNGPLPADSSRIAPAHEQAVHAEQVRLLYQQGRSGIVGMLIIAGLLAAMLWQVGDRQYVLPWLAFTITVVAGRYLAVILYFRAPPRIEDAPRWARRFTIGAVLGGVCWGLAAAVLLPMQQPLAQTAITFVIGGMTAGALPYISPVFRAYAAYLLPALLPLAATFFYLGGGLYVGMGTMALLYTALMIAAGAHSYRSYRESFTLRFQNQSLIDDLARANAELTAQIGERERVEMALGHQQERALVTLESIGDGVITTDVAGVIDYLNPVAEQLTGWPLAEARGRALAEVFGVYEEKSEQPAESPATRCLREGRIVGLPGNTELAHRNGSRFAIEESAAPIRDRHGVTVGVVLAFRDVTQERTLAQKISYQASHDPLTGLINRREFEVRLDRLLFAAGANGHEHALCYFDLDQFKIVNDTCGHIAGDELLRQLAAYLQTKVRGSDCMARLGGDEFGVLLEACSLEKGREIAELLRCSIRDFRFVWEARSYEIGASFGLVPITAGAGSLADVLSAADSACYVAKDQGRNRVHVYEPDDKILAQRSNEMRSVSRLRQALEENRLSLHYQPISALTPALAERDFCEVLLRMRDEDGQFVEPDVFLPAAERYGLMPAVDRWVTRASFAALVAGTGPCGGTIAVNLSGQSLGDPHFLGFVIEQFERSGIEPRRICFEITETAAIANLSGATRFISTLRAMGCRFALDDFGSGLSSFGYLKNLSVDYLKISGHFVRGIVNDPIDRAMVQSINGIGHVMGLTTIAECVESEAVANVLREIGVDMMQGYYIAHPKPLGGPGIDTGGKVAINIAAARAPVRSAQSRR